MDETTNYGMPKPAQHESGPTFATTFNGKMDAADTALKGALDAKMPIPYVSAYGSALIDNGSTHAPTYGSADAPTINWTLGNNQKITHDSTATWSFTAPTGPCHLTIKITHAANSTTYTPTWPGTVVWMNGGTAPSLTQTSGAVDIVSFFYDGTNYYGVASLK